MIRIVKSRLENQYLDIDEYINPSIEAKHIEMLMQFAREEEDLDKYFLRDGSLDDVGLEHDYKSHCRNAYGVDFTL